MKATNNQTSKSYLRSRVMCIVVSVVEWCGEGMSSTSWNREVHSVSTIVRGIGYANMEPGTSDSVGWSSAGIWLTVP